MNDFAAIANRYIALWNERDPAREGSARRRLDRKRGLRGSTGERRRPRPDQRAHRRRATAFPGFLFTLAGPADGYADRLRFSWALGPASEADMIKGTDFAVVEGGRLNL